jgi:hypothetical protein
LCPPDGVRSNTAILTEAKGYADTQDTATLTEAKDYADTQDETTLTEAKGYADTQDITTLTTAKEYADGKVSKSGDTMTGSLDMGGHAIDKVYTIQVAAILEKDTGSGILMKHKTSFDNIPVNNVGDPVANKDATNKEYVDTQISTKQNKLLPPYKGANNQAGILIKLDRVVEGGEEILFNILYNETQSGVLKRQAYIHGQFYGDTSRTGMLQNANVFVPVYIFKGTTEGIGNTNTCLWIPNSNTVYFPSVKAEVWVKVSTGFFDAIPLVISTMDNAPTETLIEIENKIPITLTTAKGYADTQDTATLAAAKGYVDTQKYVAADEATAESYSTSNPTIMVFYPEA